MDREGLKLPRARRSCLCNGHRADLLVGDESYDFTLELRSLPTSAPRSARTLPAFDRRQGWDASAYLMLAVRGEGGKLRRTHPWTKLINGVFRVSRT
eukprot:scaffold1466_cov249-Pinguiococcus_pyrenoidosus.AAC.14